LPETGKPASRLGPVMTDSRCRGGFAGSDSAASRGQTRRLRGVRLGGFAGSDSAASRGQTWLLVCGGFAGRVDLGGNPPGPSTNPDVPVDGASSSSSHDFAALLAKPWTTSARGRRSESQGVRSQESGAGSQESGVGGQWVGGRGPHWRGPDGGCGLRPQPDSKSEIRNPKMAPSPNPQASVVPKSVRCSRAPVVCGRQLHGEGCHVTSCKTSRS
jgi:hypothetical protein